MDAVKQLMGAYFHQDWDIDGGRVSDTVDAFLEEPRDTVIAAVDQIDELIATELPEGELERRLGSWGCAYYAGDDYRRWLSEVRNQIHASITAS